TLAIDGIEMWRHLLDRADVDEWDDDHRSRQPRGGNARDEPLHRDDRGVLGAVTPRDERHDLARFGAVDHGDGDLESGVDAGRDDDLSVRRLPTRGSRSPDGERGVGILYAEQSQKENRVHRNAPIGDELLTQIEWKTKETAGCTALLLWRDRRSHLV